MANSEKAVEDSVIKLLSDGMIFDSIAVGRWQALSEDRSSVKVYVSAQPFEDFNYLTDTPHGKITLEIVVATFIPDDPNRDAMDTACELFEEVWAGKTLEDLSYSDVFIVDGVVIGKGSSGFDDQGFQKRVYEFDLYGHKA